MPTRQDIESRMADILNRSDLTTRVPLWFDRAYIDLQRRFDFRCMEVTEYLVGFAGMAQFPTPRDMKKSRQLYLADATTGAKLYGFRETTIEEIRGVWRCCPPSGCDPVFSNWYGELLFAPSISPGQAGQTLRYDYYRYLTPEANDWFMRYAEDYLVYRGLAESAPFLGADARLQTWNAMAKDSYDTLWRQDVSSQTHAPLVMKG